MYRQYNGLFWPVLRVQFFLSRLHLKLFVMAPRNERPVGQNPLRRSARNQARQNSAVQKWQANQRPSTIFGPAAQERFDYAHATGTRNGVAQNTAGETEDDELLQRLLGHKAFVTANNQYGIRGNPPADLPEHFILRLNWHFLEGRMDRDLHTYYRTMNEGDSTIVPGQGG